LRITFDPEKRAWTLAQRGLDFADADPAFEGATIDAPDERADYARGGLSPPDSCLVGW
jgi:uncharacterized DUF497 family protein